MQKQSNALIRDLTTGSVSRQLITFATPPMEAAKAVCT